MFEGEEMASRDGDAAYGVAEGGINDDGAPELELGDCPHRLQVRLQFALHSNKLQSHDRHGLLRKLKLYMYPCCDLQPTRQAIP